MNRELAGVVACLQEIEIACGKLQNSGHDEALKELLAIIREFFKTADVAKAGEAAAYIEKLAHKPGAESLVHKLVDVDGLKSSLESLRQELLEVIEDLG